MFRPNPNPTRKLLERRIKKIGEVIQVYVDGDEEIPVHEAVRVLEVEAEFEYLGGGK